MKTYITYGAIGTIASALLNLALFFTGYQTEKLEVGQYFQYIGVVIFIVILFLGMKEKRESNADKSLSYGNAVLAALMISLFYGLFTAIYTYIHFAFVNTDFPEYMLRLVRAKMEAKNLPDGQIEAIIGMQRNMFKPAVQAVMVVIMTPIMGTILGLIIAIFVKRQPPKELIKTT